MTWNPFRLLWALWVWLLAIALLLLVTLPILALPRLESRRAAAGAFGRAFFLLAGLPVRTVGHERLPSATCIIVANHASYLDGPLLFSCLPPRFGFVIKKEASRLPIAGFMLTRLGPSLRRTAQSPRRRQRRAAHPALGRAGPGHRFFSGGHVRPRARARSLPQRCLCGGRARWRRRRADRDPRHAPGARRGTGHSALGPHRNRGPRAAAGDYGRRRRRRHAPRRGA